ncbi:MAG: hypothetical protein ABH950_08510 [Candidatus Altiarchaeota archaeon]
MYRFAGWIFRRGLVIITVIFLFHLLLGFLAVILGGGFSFGASSAERYIIHKLGGKETRYSFSGAPGDYADDFCVQVCEVCILDCYPTENLEIRCADLDCILKTKKGQTMLTKESRAWQAAWDLVILDNVTLFCTNEKGKIFCYGRSPMSEKLSYDRELPKEILTNTD